MEIGPYSAPSHSIPQSLRVDCVSIAMVGPDNLLRREMAQALARCQEVDLCEFLIYPRSPEEAPSLFDPRHDIVLIELDSDPESALDLVEGVCARRQATVMLYSKYADPDPSDPELLVRCMRAGAREFLSLPFSQENVAEALVRAASRRAVLDEPKKECGRLLAFCGVKGGTGATVIACNFAVALAEMSSDRTLLIDLDLPLGDAGLILGLAAQYSTVDALHDPQRVDSSFLSRLLVKHTSGLYVLSAPGRMTQTSVSNEGIEKLIAVARAEFPNVVVDMGARREIKGCPVFAQATSIYLVMQPGLSDLRNAHRLITEDLGSTDPRVQVVLNRHQTHGMAITDENLRRALTKMPAWKIPNDFQAIRQMQCTTRPALLADSAVGAVINKMARSLYGLPDPPVRKRSFSLKAFRKRGVSDVVESSELTSLDLSANSEVGRETWPHHPAADLRAAEQSAADATGDARGDHGRHDTSDHFTALKSNAINPRADEGQTPVTIAWADPEPIVFGTPLGAAQQNATSSTPGRFSYTPQAGYVLPAGTHSLWTTFTEDHGARRVIQQAVFLKVLRGTPNLDWPSLDSISFGSPLTEKHLCATASVPGTFSYSHVVGDVLAEGIHTLSMVFAPADGVNYSETTAEARISVTKPVPVISWSPACEIVFGDALSSEQLNATASVAGVFDYMPPAGTVLSAGEHLLTAIFRPADEQAFEQARTTSRLLVQRATPRVEWRTPAAIPFGTSLCAAQLCASSPIPGRFAYSPGEGTTLRAGRHTLSARFLPEDDQNYVHADCATSLTVAKAVPVVLWNAPSAIVYGCPLGSRQLNATSSVPGTFQYIPAAGAVLSAGTHTPVALFTPANTEDWAEAQCAVSLTVLKVVPTIEWSRPQKIAYGTSLGPKQLCAKGSVPGTVTFNPGPGTMLPIGEHLLTVDFRPSDSSNFSDAHASVAIEVTEAVPTAIQWAIPEPIRFGQLLSPAQLNATASVPGEFTYSVKAGEMLNAGKHPISVVFTPHDRNIPPSHTQTVLTVEKAVPDVRWDTPDPIIYGTRLSSRQLQASCIYPGQFTYKPQAGAQLEAGQQVLSAWFQPDDTANISEIRAQVHLVVDPACPVLEWHDPAAIRYGDELTSLQLNAKSSVPGNFSYVPGSGTVLTPGRHHLTVFFSPLNKVNFQDAQAEVSLEVTGLQYKAADPDQLCPHSIPFTPLASCSVSLPGDALLTGKNDCEKADLRAVAVAPGKPPIQSELPVHSAAVSETARRSDPVGTAKPETRTYKGATYEKGCDGQWHLLSR